MQTVLIVDDHPSNLRILVDALQDSGFDVAVSQDGESALNRARLIKPDLILLDVMMPGINGFETCRRLKADITTNEIPVIFMTALVQTEDKVTGFEVGGIDYVTKPIDLTEVLARINTHLSLRQANLTLQQSRDMFERRVKERTADLENVLLALEENERKFRTIFENMQDGYILTDMTGSINLVNPATLQTLNYQSDQELIGKNIVSTIYVHENTDKDLKTELQKAGKVSGYEVTFHTKDRQHIIVDFSTHFVYDSSGCPVGIEGIFRDITERKQAEENLRKWEHIFKNTEWGIAASDPQTYRLTLMNPAFARIHGYTIEELTGKPIINLFVDQPKIHRIIHQAQDRGHSLFESIQRRKDNSTFPALINITAIKDNLGNLQYQVASVHDITELKQTEAALRQRNRELELLNRIIAISSTDLAPGAILDIACSELGIFFQVSGVIATEYNPQAKTSTVIADYEAEERASRKGVTISTDGNPMVQHLQTFMTPFVAVNVPEEPLLDSIRELLQLEDTASILILPLMIDDVFVGSLFMDTIEPRHFSPQEINLAWSVTNQVSGVLARAYLHQQQRQLEAQYHQAQKMESIGRLAGGIAHDFNNLLVPIMGYAELGMMSISPDNELYSQLTQIKQAAERAASLTKQILAFSRRQVLEISTLDLNEIITDFHKMIKRLIGEDVVLQTTLTPSPNPVRVDKTQIEQVLMNLTINARDAMPKGGELTLETSNVYLDEAFVANISDVSSGNYVMLAVQDTGHGIDAETKERIFEPFYTTKEHDKGTGLGLATVFGIVKQHQGHISVESEVGQGTRFKIYLPQADEVEPADQSEATEPISRHGTETLLVVEDEDSVRELVSRALETHGYKIIEAKSPKQGLELVAKTCETIDLLLTDIIMPQMNGLALYEKIITYFPDMKVVYMSGYTNNIMVQHNITGNDVNFLRKPFNIYELTKKIRDTLGQGDA